ncbi:MAG: hypothetical protein EHM79_20145 [Geobacter sp.]|nr:MAG: hypothetical protein EHM79_20145 [Geobacter sp.]
MTIYIFDEFYYFHGTDAAESILKYGFSLNVPQKHDTFDTTWKRYMLGRGIYFTTSLRKAKKFGRQVLRCKIGKIRVLYTNREFRDKFDENKYDAIYCPGKFSRIKNNTIDYTYDETALLSNDELMIKNPSLITEVLLFST